MFRSPSSSPRQPLAIALGCLCLLQACSDDDASQADAGPPDARILPDVSPLGPDPDFDEGYVGVGPDRTVTTLTQTERPRYGYDDPVADRWGRLRIPASEVGMRYPQPGEPFTERNDLQVADATPIQPQSLLYFLHLSDVQLLDSQSPAYTPANKYTALGSALPAWHSQGPLAPHLLDAAVRTALQFSIRRPFDFVIHTGDAIEDAQENELDWFLTILDGGLIYPDSGDADDPVPGPDNDAWDPFLAQGLPSGMDWYAVIGNHDINVLGNFPAGLIEEANQEQYQSRLAPLLAEYDVTLPGVGTGASAPNALAPDTLPAFTADPSDFDPQVMWTEAELRALEPGPVVADPQRATVDGCGYIDAHFDSATDPVGHGFTQASRQTCQGYYAVDPVPGVPLRLIVLDSGPHVGGAQGVITPPLNPDGSVNEALRGDPAHDQIAWLTAELDQAIADNVAVIVTSHHASGSISRGSLFAGMFELFFPEEEELNDLWTEYFVDPDEYLSGEDLRVLLTGYPNVILHLVGHSHENKVNAVCPDAEPISGEDLLEGVTCADPPAGLSAVNGYWEVMAASPRDFPNQFRITEIVDNGNGTGTIYSTVVTPQAGPGSLMHLGLFLALADHQLDGKRYRDESGSIADRNVALQIAWPGALIGELATVNAATRIESLTTLGEVAPGLPTLPEWP